MLRNHNEANFEALVRVAASVATQNYISEVKNPWDTHWQALTGRLAQSLPLDFSIADHMQTWRWHFTEIKSKKSLWVVGKIFDHCLPAEYPEISKAAQIIQTEPIFQKKDARPSVLGVEAIRNTDKTYQYPRIDLLSHLVCVVADNLDSVEIAGLGEDRGVVLNPFPDKKTLAGKESHYRYAALQELSNPLSTDGLGHISRAFDNSEISADITGIEGYLRARFITPEIVDPRFTLLGKVADFLDSDAVCFNTAGKKL